MSAAPAQDVHSLLIAFLFELVNGVLGAAGNKSCHGIMRTLQNFHLKKKDHGFTLPDWSVTSLT